METESGEFVKIAPEISYGYLTVGEDQILKATVKLTATYANPAGADAEHPEYAVLPKLVVRYVKRFEYPAVDLPEVAPFED